MVLEKVLWTALPNHFDANGRLRISVHVAPRLVNHDGSSTQRKLEECPAFVDWPARLATLKFKVEFDSGVTAEGDCGGRDRRRAVEPALPARHAAPAVRVPGPRRAQPARLPGAGRAPVHPAGLRRRRRAGHRPSVDRRRLRPARALRAARASRGAVGGLADLLRGAGAGTLAQAGRRQGRARERGERVAAARPAGGAEHAVRGVPVLSPARQSEPRPARRLHRTEPGGAEARLPPESQRARRPPAGAAPARAGRRSRRGARPRSARSPPPGACASCRRATCPRRRRSRRGRATSSSAAGSPRDRSRSTACTARSST